MDINEIKPKGPGDRQRSEEFNAILEATKKNAKDIDGVAGSFQGDVVPSFNFTNAPKGIFAPLESGPYGANLADGGVVVDLELYPLTELIWNGVYLSKKAEVEIVVPEPDLSDYATKQDIEVIKFDDFSEVDPSSIIDQPIVGDSSTKTKALNSFGLQLGQATSSSSLLIAYILPFDLSENEIINRLEFRIDAFNLNPHIGIGVGNTATNRYGSIVYRQDGSIQSTTLSETGLPVFTNLALVSERPGQNYIVGDIIGMSFIINKSNGTLKVITDKNGIVFNQEYSVALTDYTNFYVQIRARGMASFRFNYQRAKFLLNDGVIDSEIQNLNSRVTNIESGSGASTALTRSATDIIHIIMYGQSLSLGTRSIPVLSLSAKYNVLMFKGGVRVQYDYEGQSLPSDYYSDFVPLVEFPSGNPVRFGETPLSGINEAFHQMFVDEGRKIISDGTQLLMSAPGKGSTALINLSKGSASYALLINEVVQGLAVANAKGKTYSVPYICWNQGEEDIDLLTPKNTYKAQLVQLQADLNTDIKAITGQADDVILVTYQTSSHSVRGSAKYTGIAEAQYEAAIENPDKIILSNSTYFLPYDGDNVHLNNVGSKWNGANHGAAIKEHMDKGSFKPIHPISHFVQGKVCNIKFSVPTFPLVFDTTIVTNPGNYGFRVFDGATEMTITSVSLTKGDTVTIACSATIPAGATIWYGINGTTTGAVNGSRGNLRDSRNIVFDPSGINKTMYNWCPIFKYQLD